MKMLKESFEEMIVHLEQDLIFIMNNPKSVHQSEKCCVCSCIDMLKWALTELEKINQENFK